MNKNKKSKLTQSEDTSKIDSIADKLQTLLEEAELDGIDKFDLIENNCPTMKMLEFDGFDKKK